MRLLPSQLPNPSGFGSFGARVLVQSGPGEILMAALSRDAHRRRVFEHQAKVAADRGKPVPTPIPSSSDPQLKIRLIGEVKRTDETVEPKRGRRRSRKRAQPDLGV
jgi:hypothetical protein